MPAAPSKKRKASVPFPPLLPKKVKEATPVPSKKPIPVVLVESNEKDWDNIFGPQSSIIVEINILRNGMMILLSQGDYNPFLMVLVLSLNDPEGS